MIAIIASITRRRGLNPNRQSTTLTVITIQKNIASYLPKTTFFLLTIKPRLGKTFNGLHISEPIITLHISLQEITSFTAPKLYYSMDMELSSRTGTREKDVSHTKLLNPIQIKLPRCWIHRLQVLSERLRVEVHEK